MFYTKFLRMASTVATKNRLAYEKSAYLLQHASNPVDWYPWGKEAFEKAKKEDKPIFLSVGYSTCHWCHVMEHESFEDETVAKYLNENFLNIKMDREERPDIDKQYMSYVQAMTGHGGWPMSMWLTPELKGIISGTYFPKDDNQYTGQPGFLTILKRFIDQWKNKRDVLENQAQRLTEALGSNSLDVLSGTDMPNQNSIKRLANNFERRYDRNFGGFSKAPKFPQPGIMLFLFRHFIWAKNNPSVNSGDFTAVEAAMHTLEMMARGGIHDHVGKGFHRYSVDNRWHVPHFEKMLYDQSQLCQCYSEAFQLSREQRFADTLEGILTYMFRDLKHPEGGFYAAEDADSHETHGDNNKKVEGAFYSWSQEELKTIFETEHGDSRLSDIFMKVFDIQPFGNVERSSDPHGELKGKNVLIQRKPLKDMAKELAMEEEDLKNEINRACKILFEKRDHRPRPHRDEKFVSTWNGMAISGLCKAGLALSKPEVIEKAIDCANFIKKYLITSDRKLLRCCYADSQKRVVQLDEPIEGVCLDYACVTAGFLDLYEATLDSKWLKEAEKLQSKQDELFWDNSEGHESYFVSVNPDLLFKLKDEQDGAEPGSNSVASMNLLRLAEYTGNEHFKNKAEAIFKTYSELIDQMAIAVPHLMAAFVKYHSSNANRVIFFGDSMEEFNFAFNKACDIFKSLFNANDEFMVERHEWLKELKKNTDPDFKGVILIRGGNEKAIYNKPKDLSPESYFQNFRV